MDEAIACSTYEREIAGSSLVGRIMFIIFLTFCYDKDNRVQTLTILCGKKVFHESS